jgi:hypothetical protein
MISTQVAEERYSLLPTEFEGWNRIGRRLSQEGSRLLLHTPIRPKDDEWIGLFETANASEPSLVFQGQAAQNCILNNVEQILVLMRRHDTYCPMSTSRILLPMSQPAHAVACADNRWQVTGHPMRVRVQEIVKGPRKRKILLYYGKTRNLDWDPTRWKWPGSIDFMKYSTKMGRELLRKRHPPLQLAQHKWQPILPVDFRFRWTNVWDHERQRKEAYLLWQVWHRAVAINTWRGKISINIDKSCVVCQQGVEETVLHRFWTCQGSQTVWTYVTRLLNYLAFPDQAPSWTIPDWKQAIFAKRPPRRFRTVSRYWTLLRGIALWTIWTSRNDVSFNSVRWSREKIESVIWQSFSDYSRSAWNKTRLKVMREPASAGLTLARFDTQWLKPAICTREGLSITWVRVRPAGIG